MKKTLSVVLAMLLILTLMIPTVCAAGAEPWQSLVHKPGRVAYEHMKVLTQEIGPRAAGSDKEVEAREYIAGEFERLGFETTVQEFTYTRGGRTYNSANVVAVKPGKSSKVVIVGAHYDSVTAGKGADDNASGVGVMLEVAEVLEKIPTPYTIKFIAFGAEEVGLKGSNYYASQMTDEEIENTVVMINLDSLAVGDKMYVYGGEGKDGWVREQALNAAKKLKLNLETNPGINPDYPEGTTGLWSDHAAFVMKGIPYAYFEATNWELGDYDGYTQTVKDGEIWHTSKDTIAYIEENYPGRLEEHLSTFSQVLRDLLKFLDKPRNQSK